MLQAYAVELAKLQKGSNLKNKGQSHSCTKAIQIKTKMSIEDIV